MMPPSPPEKMSMEAAAGPHFTGLRLSASPTANALTANALSHQPFVIGVSGGTASGKTTVCDMIIQQLHDHHVVLIYQASIPSRSTPLLCSDLLQAVLTVPIPQLLKSLCNNPNPLIAVAVAAAPPPPSPNSLARGLQAMDPRQVLAAFLTLSMFAMLGNMIKRDHFDTLELRIPEAAGVQLGVMKLEEQEAVSTAQPSEVKGPWLAETAQQLRPCWAKLGPKDGDETKGYVTFSLTIGPEYHISQVTDAVVIARYLGATLVLPDIRGSELGKTRNFEDMYDVDKFTKNLDGVVKIAKELPAEFSAKKPSVVRVPNRVSEEFIVKNIEPFFRTNSYLRLASTFPSINLKMKQTHNSDVDSTACLAMFGSLELKPDIREMADQMVERLRTLGHKSDGHFVAVDLLIDVLEKKSCKESGTNRKKICYNAQEIGDFLKRTGFNGDTVVYLTQTWWHESLNTLKEAFPKTYTKDDIIPAEKKGNFLRSGSAELERALDLHICTHSDVFVPAISGLFYGNIVGKRIASGKTQVLVPSQVSGSVNGVSDFISTYISKKNHLAYSCYC